MLELKSLSDLQRLVEEGFSESLTLEFKSSPALAKDSLSRSELVKDITAFANSAGGQIVFGISESNGSISLDEGIDGKMFPAEWIGQVIDTNTSPRLQGITVNRISLNDQTDRVYFAINIPAATSFAPHQNTIDKKYYRRFELRSVPMYDYEIRDLMRRSRTPELKATMSFTDGRNEISYSKGDEIEIETIMENLSDEPASFSLFEFGFDQRLKITNTAGFKRVRDFDVGDYKMAKLQKLFMVPHDFPLLKGTHTTVGPPRITIKISDPHFKNQESFYLACFATCAGFKKGWLAWLDFNDGMLKFSDFQDVSD